MLPVQPRLPLGRTCRTARPVWSRVGVTAAQSEGTQEEGRGVDMVDDLFSGSLPGGGGTTKETA